MRLCQESRVTHSPVARKGVTNVRGPRCRCTDNARCILANCFYVSVIFQTTFKSDLPENKALGIRLRVLYRMNLDVSSVRRNSSIQLVFYRSRIPEDREPWNDADKFDRRTGRGREKSIVLKSSWAVRGMNVRAVFESIRIEWIKEYLKFLKFRVKVN